MNLKKYATLFFLGLAVAACGGANRTVITAPQSEGPLTASQVVDLKVTELDVIFEDVEPAKLIHDGLLRELRKALPTCQGTGSATKMVVAVEGYAGLSSASVIIGGGGIGINGFVRFYEPGSDKLLAEYYLEEMTVFHGLLGAAEAAPLVEKLPTRFTERVCVGIFKKAALSQ